MGLLPCPNLLLWVAEKSFSSSDENHFPLQKGFLSCSPLPSKSPTNYAVGQAKFAAGRLLEELQFWRKHLRKDFFSVLNALSSEGPPVTELY